MKLKTTSNWRPLPKNQYLTSLSYSLILKSIKNGSRLRVHPYVWNEATQRMERTADRGRLAVWYLNVLTPVANFVFVTIRAFQVFHDDNASPRDTIMACFGVAYYLFPAMFQLTYFLCGDELPGLINQSLKLLSDLNRDVPPTNLKPHQRYPVEVRLAEMYAYNIYYGFQLLGVMFLIFGFQLPETKFLISSLHDDPRNLRLPYRLLFLIYLAYMTFLSYTIGSWMIGIGIGLTFPLCVALQALRDRHLTSETIKYYRCLQLWISKFNRIFSALMLPIAEIFLIILSTLGIVGVIRYPGILGLYVGNVGLTTYFILYLFLRFFGTIDDRSRETMQRWKFEARGFFARQLRALQPISVSIGSYFYVDRSLILTATNIIVNNSITLLLVA